MEGSIGESNSSDSFDFESHRRRVVEDYGKVKSVYSDFAVTIRRILEVTLSSKGVQYHNVEARAKDIDSLAKKATKPSDTNSGQPRYTNPLDQITDLAGARVITFFPRTLIQVDECIKDEFDVIEKVDKADKLEEEGKFGYKSIHYLVKMKKDRVKLPEYKPFEGLVGEIQARTILQHAWAEMEHDIQYKSVDVIPISLKRRFIALAGMLEIADREFQNIQDEDDSIRKQARINVKEGNLQKVEITPDALKSYLDKKLGTDGRVSFFSYDFLARQLRQMGFVNFQQIDDCIRRYDDNQISRTIWGSRQGQISRFEDTLLAAMGDNFIKLHSWSKEEWWLERGRVNLKILEEAGIEIGHYTPKSET